jgi:energy-coupling factor transport system ATP-binding protein
MIVLEDVSFSHSADGQPLFEKLSLTIDHRSWVVLTGPDGAGKTTLGKIIKGLLRPDSGKVIFDPALLSGPGEVGYVGGDPYDFTIGVTVEEDIVFGLETMRLSPEEMRLRVGEALHRTGLSGMEHRLVHTLSGGEQQRLAFAALLAMEMKVLMLDESLAMIDRRQRASIRALVTSLHGSSGVTVIEATCHVEDMLTADRVIFLDGGRVAFDGGFEAFLTSPHGERWVSMSAGMVGLGYAMGERGLISGGSVRASDIIIKLRHLYG